MALDDTARRFFHAPNLIHVARQLPSGAPHSVPVWCRVEGDRIAFFSQPATRKERNLALDPRVAISAVSHENPYSMVQVRGRVDETLEGEAALAVIDRIAQDYIGGPFPMRTGVVFLVEPDKVQHMDLPFEHKA